MNIDRNLKVGIIAGLIAMALFYFLLIPILSLCGKAIMVIASKIYSAYIDRLFERASLGIPIDYAFTLLMLFVGLVTGLVTGSLIYSFRLYRLERALKKGKPKPPPRVKKVKTELIITIIIAVIWYISSTLALWGAWFNIKTTTSFIQHMYTLAPFISEDEEEVIWSQWTQMRSKYDYEEIYKRLNEIAERNGVKLSENPVYTFKKF